MIEQAVILAGGKGTRLMPLTKNTPKPLVLVGQKPFLVWQLLFLKNQGVKRVLLLVSHFSEQIIKYFTDHPIEGLKISFSVEPEPMGTGGAVVHALNQLEEEFFLLNGDSFAPIDYRHMENVFRQDHTSISMATISASLVPEVAGNVKIVDGKVSEYKKDAGYDWIDSGVYIYKKSVLENLVAGSYGIEKTWEDSIKKRLMLAHIIEQRFFDIGTPERLKNFEDKLDLFFTSGTK